jgi:YVTN family beta-propeller protein
VWVISTATNTLIAMIPVGNNGPGSGSSNGLGGVAVSPDGSRVYVAESNPNPNSVLVIDTATNTIAATIPLPGTSNTFNVAVSPNGRKLYVTSFTSNTTSVIDTTTNTVVATIPVGNFPEGVAVTPDGSRVYVANAFSNNVSVIDAGTNAVTATIPVGSGPVAFGLFIQPELRFAGTPGTANCIGQSIAALTRQFVGLNAAAAALWFSSVSALQNAIMAFCEG